jgi:phosphoribosyl 1,2-cyclic phosphodiesterase
VQVAAQSGARRLALFHHDPEHYDAMLDQLAHQADVQARHLGVGEVVAASEGCTLSLAAATAGAR